MYMDDTGHRRRIPSAKNQAVLYTYHLVNARPLDQTLVWDIITEAFFAFLYTTGLVCYETRYCLVTFLKFPSTEFPHCNFKKNKRV
jgi:hypothetical protein